MTTEAAKSLSKMNKAELLAEAARFSIEIPTDATNPDIVKLIEAARAAQPAVTQELPTQPRPTDDSGRQLDEFKLPISGPVRARALAELRKPDPRTNPEAWADAPAADQAE